jgi:uncharacterized membrane protein YeaQ/YmgE (transglycosylase-associated protein family)
MLSPGAVFLLLLIIGIAAGLLFDRVAGAGWLSRQIAGPNRLLVTSALVGIAGSFVGYHLALLIGIAGYGALLVAVIGALAVLWGWRTVRCCSAAAACVGVSVSAAARRSAEHNWCDPAPCSCRARAGRTSHWQARSRRRR